jgi:hypothetical protein
MTDTTHDCSSVIGGLAAMITSLTVCCESDVWSCKSTGKNAKIAAFSIAFFVLVNAMQPHMSGHVVGILNQIAGLMPSLLFVGNELLYCKTRTATLSAANYSATKDLVKIVPTILLPILVFNISGNTKIHDVVCEGLHKLHAQMPAAGAAAKTSSMKYIENVRLNAENALSAAQKSLKNAYDNNASCSASYSAY